LAFIGGRDGWIAFGGGGVEQERSSRTAIGVTTNLGMVLVRGMADSLIERRIEVDGNIASLLDRLRASGCFTERINFQTRVFVSVDPFRGTEVIGNLQEAFSGGGA
jgi:hypothetical protein